MKRTYKLVSFASYERVRYYTIQNVDDDISEGDKFFQQFEGLTGELKVRFQELYTWMVDIGRNRGAKEYLFRSEKAAKALPPSFEHTGYFPEPGESSIRLYCVWLSESIVIVINGGIKTAQKVKDCPNCYPIFLLANSIAREINLSIRNNSISLGERKINFRKKSFIIEIE